MSFPLEAGLVDGKQILTLGLGAQQIPPIVPDFVREDYYGALWNLLFGLALSGQVVTASRKVRLLEDLSDGELPALFFAVEKQTVKWPALGDPPIHTLRATAYLYAANPDPNVSADMALNGLLDAVEAIVKPSAAIGRQTLGGLVHKVEMGGDAGDIEVFAGPNGQRAAAIVPIAITVFDDF